MLYFDYTWDLNPQSIVLDQELDTDKLHWNDGDYWKMVIKDGKKMLVKLDKLEEFILKGAGNGLS